MVRVFCGLICCCRTLRYCDENGKASSVVFAIVGKGEVCRSGACTGMMNVNEMNKFGRNTSISMQMVFLKVFFTVHILEKV